MEPADSKRILVIDIARLYAMALVFYGHFIERIMLLENPAAAAQYKFVYSFHMLLFFVLAGYVARESDLVLGFGRYLKYRVLSRLLLLCRAGLSAPASAQHRGVPDRSPEHGLRDPHVLRAVVVYTDALFR